jgi:deoxyribodipyrimidine photo-lyase
VTGFAVPPIRVRAVDDRAARPDGDFVLYWMVMARRTVHSFALQRAVEWAREAGRPLLVLEALRAGYPWASARFHRFAIDAMADNAAAFARAGVRHHPYVEPKPGAGKGLLEALAERACVVVTDEYPDFFLPRMLDAAGRRAGVRLEAVDGNGLLPLRAAPRAFTHSHHFRRWYQGELPAHLAELPEAEPLRRLPRGPAAVVPRAVLERWRAAPAALLRGDAAALAALPIDHEVPPVPFRGGPVHGAEVLRSFLRARLPRYRAEKNEPEAAVTSGLSPYLHWGFVSAHQVLAGLAEAEGWTPERVALKPTGKREGWWGMGPEAEAFLDELVTWRELSYNTAHFVEGHDRYDTLPEWALRTLEKHAGDARPALLSRDAMEGGHSPDALWNATQGQLRADGRIHNYMRIVWGKRFLEWTRTPRDAAEWMLHVNNRWALDGRNPNSVSGIMWTLGRYDRAWGPERPVYGTVRYVSSANTARKVRVRGYVHRYAPTPGTP